MTFLYYMKHWRVKCPQSNNICMKICTRSLKKFNQNLMFNKFSFVVLQFFGSTALPSIPISQGILSRGAPPIPPPLPPVAAPKALVNISEVIQQNKMKCNTMNIFPSYLWLTHFFVFFCIYFMCMNVCICAYVCVYLGAGKPKKDNKEFDIAEALSRRKPLRKTANNLSLGT